MKTISFDFFYSFDTLNFSAACEQELEVGPCSGNYQRWYYNKESDACEPFTYGGCKGNKNNFVTEDACKYQCKRPGVQKGEWKLILSSTLLLILNAFLCGFLVHLLILV